MIKILLWWDLAQALLDSWVLQQIREELWELNDETTSKLVTWYKKWIKSDSISLNKFRKKYDL